MQTMGWTQGVTFRVLGIGLLALLMLIPLVQVQSLVGERRGLEQEARLKIGERWGGEQIVGGPVLVVPVRTAVHHDKGFSHVDVDHFVLPETLRIEGAFDTERRSYGIYETPVYTADLRISGRFGGAAFDAIRADGGEVQWRAAVLRVPIADVRGIRSVSALRVDGRELAFGPGGGVSGMAATEVAWPLDGNRGDAATEFAFELRLAGTAVLQFLPLAQQTEVSLDSAWPDPGFVGAFLPATRETGESGFKAQWQAAVLRVPIADVRGIRSVSALRIDGRELAFGPGGDISGMTATEVVWPLDGQRGDAAAEFAFELRLAGTAVLQFLPLARQTEVSLGSAWPDPGFVGAFLPATRDTAESGFRAHWQVLDLNRQFGQHWASGNAPMLEPSAFGVELYQPVGTYQRNERAGKYGILFVAMSFVALFLIDALGRWRVHPVQYLLVGVALCTFYVVLLALSEQVGFGPAYLVAAGAVAVMIGGYAVAAARSRRAGIALGGLLAFVYALLYGLVVSEQYSLLMGAIALLVSIGLLMYLTRRVDWYALGPARIDVPTGMGPR